MLTFRGKKILYYSALTLTEFLTPTHNMLRILYSQVAQNAVVQFILTIFKYIALFNTSSSLTGLFLKKNRLGRNRQSN